MGTVHSFPGKGSPSQAPGVITMTEDELMKILRCAIFIDSAMKNVPSRVFLQLSPEAKEKVQEWIEREWGDPGNIFSR